MFFLLSGMNAAEMAVLSAFWQKNGLGTLGVKKLKNYFYFYLIVATAHGTLIQME